MNNNFQPSEDTFDDVSGHAPTPAGSTARTPRTPRATPSASRASTEDEDTEGHATRGKGRCPRTRTPRATGLRGNIEATDDDEDTEGHGVRIKI